MLVLLTHFSIHPSSFLVDVEELHQWHVAKCTAHPFFERLPDEEVLRGQSALQLPSPSLPSPTLIHTLSYAFMFPLINLDRRPFNPSHMLLSACKPRTKLLGSKPSNHSLVSNAFHPSFVFVQSSDDPAVNAMCEETEESKKVSRIGGRKYFAVFRRKHESELLAQTPRLIDALFS